MLEKMKKLRYKSYGMQNKIYTIIISITWNTFSAFGSTCCYIRKKMTFYRNSIPTHNILLRYWEGGIHPFLSSKNTYSWFVKNGFCGIALIWDPITVEKSHFAVKMITLLYSVIRWIFEKAWIHSFLRVVKVYVFFFWFSKLHKNKNTFSLQTQHIVTKKYRHFYIYTKRFFYDDGAIIFQ